MWLDTVRQSIFYVYARQNTHTRQHALALVSSSRLERICEYGQATNGERAKARAEDSFAGEPDGSSD